MSLFLVPELCMHIMEKLDWPKAAIFCSINKCAWSVYCTWLREYCRLCKIVLRKSQGLIRDQCLISSGAISLQAQMSWGKTITALSVAFKEGNPITKWVFLVPPKAFTTWINQIEKVFGKDTVYCPHNPRESQVLALLTAQSKNHVDWFTENGPTENTKILLVTPNSGNAVKALAWAEGVIVDEAHKGGKWRNMIHNKKYKLLLSAYPVSYDCDLYLKPKNDIIVPETKANYYHLPILGHDYSDIPKCFPFHIDPVLVAGMSHIYKSELSKVLDNVGSAAVLFVPGGNTLQGLIANIQKLCEEKNRELFTFTRSLKVIQKFEKARGDRLLLMHHEQSECININADSCIVLHPEYVNLGRIKQIVHRVLRTTNRNDIVDVHYICAGYASYMKAVYSESLRVLNYDSDTLVTPESMLKALSITRSLGYRSPTLLAPADIVVICNEDFSVNKRKDLYELWCNSEGLLTQEEIRDLLLL